MFKNLLVLAIIVLASVSFVKIALPKLDEHFADSAGEVTVVKKASYADIREFVEIETIPFKTTVKSTNALRIGTESVAQKGQVGERTVTYAITYKDGKEVSRKKKFDRVTKPAVDEIVIRGTLVVEGR